ncbi:hypothetical protein [Nocardia sp. NPDC002869]|uniref:hypothetical protein n=1 Tax=Nocardia sp. NPDC002869 TaxID=3161032 RepID=UPI00398D2426
MNAAATGLRIRVCSGWSGTGIEGGSTGFGGSGRRAKARRTGRGVLKTVGMPTPKRLSRNMSRTIS